MKAKSRKSRLRRSGSKFERMILRALAHADFSRLSGRIFEEQINNAISIQLYIHNFEVIAIRPESIRKLWEVPQKAISLYVFCPDERIRTHRLLGKPALGPSPPQLN